eukprot:438070_1
MFKSLKKVVSESESAALSISNLDEQDESDDVNALSSDPQTKSKENKSVKIIRSISSNIKEKLQKKKFHRLDLQDKASDSIEDDIENDEDENDVINIKNNVNKIQLNNNKSGDRSFSQLEIQEQMQLTENKMNANINRKYSNYNDLLNEDEEEDYDIELSQISNEDDGNDSVLPHKQIQQNQFEDTYSFCVGLSSIFCHLLTMIFVSFTQIMVCSSLYIIVPLHVTITLEGEELLTGLIFLNYGFAYLVFNIFGTMCSNYYGSTFTILLSILISSISLLFMAIFTDYFVWLMMMFCQGISFALFTVGSQTFVVDNLCIKSRTHFDKLITAFRILAMWFGCTFSGSAIDNGSIVFATGVTFGISLCGIVLLCAFSIPPKYNDNCLVSNDITKASFMAWKASLKQLSLKQRLSVFSWMRRKNNKAVDNTPIYALDDELNLLQVFAKNASTILSISIFSFGLIFVRCVRLLVITFQCMQVDALSPSDIGYINGLSFVPELILYNISWYLLYTFGRRYTLIASHLLFVVALFNLPYSKNIASLSVVSMLFGIANGLSYGLIHKVAIDVAPTEYREKFLTLYHIFTNVAYIVAPIFVALLVQAASVVTACVCS